MECSRDDHPSRLEDSADIFLHVYKPSFVMISPAFLQNTLMLLHNCRHDFIVFFFMIACRVLPALVIVLAFISCPGPDLQRSTDFGVWDSKFNRIQ